MAAELLRKYDDTFFDDQSKYFEPDAKRDSLRKDAENLMYRIARVNDKDPSFDEVVKMATELATKAKAEPEKPEHDKTKLQIYEEIVEELSPLLRDELNGKLVRIKHGAHDFTFMKIDEVTVEISMQHRLDINIAGPGFAFTTDQGNNLSGLPNFRTFNEECTNDMLMYGKDPHLNKWIDIVSEDCFRGSFTAIYETVAKNLGISLEPPKESK